jgi:hypothetical protein
MLKDKMAKLFFLKSTIPYLKNKIKAKKKKRIGGKVQVVEHLLSVRPWFPSPVISKNIF